MIITSSNQTLEIWSFLKNYFSINRQEVEPKRSFQEYSTFCPTSMAAINILYDELLHPGDVFEKYPSVLKIYDMDVLAIHPDYRRQGWGV